MPRYNWGKFEIARRRTFEYEFELYEADRVTAVQLAASDVVRFKLYTDDNTIKLDIDSLGATSGGSIITVNDLGDVGNNDPAVVTVKFGEGDTGSLPVGDYNGEILVVDDSETIPSDAIKRPGKGLVECVESGGGDVGLVDS